ncbi:MAG: SCO family protein [Deltaproteobacteria bacterium]|nr:SCO family protein [Deltaproteobacteria bacterium]
MSQPSATRRTLLKVIFAVIVLCVVAWVVRVVVRGVIAANTSAESYVSSAPRPRGTRLPVLFRGPTFDLVSANGERIRSESLRGKVWIANFIFTQCTSICPTMTARLMQLARRLRAPDARFVSISVDPVHDTPEALRAFASHWPGDPRWLLFATTPDSLQAVARALRVSVVASANPNNPIDHSRLLTLIDAHGDVRAIYDSDDALAWGRIHDDVLELLGPGPQRATMRQDTASPVLVRYGCTGCHDRVAVAPPLAGGAHRTVRLATGETVMADDEYLRESLCEPSRKLTAGYAPIMPRYSHLTRPELDAIVAAISALPPPAPVAAGSAAPTHGGPAEDPICHMQVSTVDPALTVHEGELSVHFCSQSCLNAYVARARRDSGASSR